MTVMQRTLAIAIPYRPPALAGPRRFLSLRAPSPFAISLTLAGTLGMLIGLYVFAVNASLLEGLNLLRLEQSFKGESRELEKAVRELARLSSPQVLARLSRSQAMAETIQVSFIREAAPLLALPRPEPR